MTLRTGFAHALILLALAPAPLCAQASVPSDSVLRRVALRVAELDQRRQMPGATAATVDSLLALYSDSIVYEHPSVGAVVRGKPALRTGMLRYLGSRPGMTMETPTVVMGALVALLETPAHPDPRAPTRPIPTSRKALRVLEFDSHGLVRRVLDYPW